MGAFDLSAYLWPDDGQGRQPQTNVEIAPEFARRLLGVFNPAAREQKWVTTGALASSIVSSGLALDASPGSVSKATSGNQSTGYTILISGVVAQAGSAQDLAGIYNGSTYQALVYLTAAKKMSFYYKNGGVAAFPCKDAAVGMAYTVAVSANGSRYTGVLNLDGEITVIEGSYSGTAAYTAVHVGSKFAPTRPTKSTLGAFWATATSGATLNALVNNPWQIFAPQPIPFVIESGGNIHTITPAGALSLVGSVTQLHEKSLTTTGSVALTGTALLTFTNGATTYTIIPSGSITLSGTNNTNKYHLLVPQGNITLSGNAVERRVRATLPTGSINFSGDTSIAEVRVFSSSGNVTFSGTAQLYMPGMKIETTSILLTGTGV